MLFGKALISAALAITAANVVSADTTFFTDDVDLLRTLDMRALLDGWDETFHEHGLNLTAVHFHDPNPDSEYAFAAPEERDVSRIESYMHPRAAVQATCQSPKCIQPRYELFTPAQERFITGKFCQVIATYSPPAGGYVLGLVASKAVCRGNKKCTVIVSLSAAVGSAYPAITSALQGACTQSYNAISNGCGDYGGSDTCLASGKGATRSGTYSVSGQAPGTGCPSGSAKCTRITCDNSNDNCQNY